MSYGYNKYSSSMSSRGRGFSSRGGSSYRGRGGGGDWGGGSATGGMTGRGGYSSSRGGRFKYSTPSYDSRSKYTSGGGSERYSSRGGRGDHSNSYKRPRESYSGRDEHRSSSESTRKRIRNDSYQRRTDGCLNAHSFCVGRLPVERCKSIKDYIKYETSYLDDRHVVLPMANMLDYKHYEPTKGRLIMSTNE